jgi:hypothetical protein
MNGKCYNLDVSKENEYFYSRLVKQKEVFDKGCFLKVAIKLKKQLCIKKIPFEGGQIISWGL